MSELDTFVQEYTTSGGSMIAITDIDTRSNSSLYGALDISVDFTIGVLLSGHAMPTWAAPSPLIAAMREHVGLPVNPAAFANTRWIVSSIDVTSWGRLMGPMSTISFTVQGVSHRALDASHFEVSTYWHTALNAFLKNWLLQDKQLG